MGRRLLLPCLPPMEPVSITYLSVPICADAQLAESDETGARIATREPMPVGTEIEIVLDGKPRRARVTSVAELLDAGMRVAFVAAPRESATPQPAAAEVTESKPKRRKKKSE